LIVHFPFRVRAHLEMGNFIPNELQDCSQNLGNFLGWAGALRLYFEVRSI
jgi:hypothetical protein